MRTRKPAARGRVSAAALSTPTKDEVKAQNKRVRLHDRDGGIGERVHVDMLLGESPYLDATPKITDKTHPMLTAEQRKRLRGIQADLHAVKGQMLEQYQRSYAHEMGEEQLEEDVREVAKGIDDNNRKMLERHTVRMLKARPKPKRRKSLTDLEIPNAFA